MGAFGLWNSHVSVDEEGEDFVNSDSVVTVGGDEGLPFRSHFSQAEVVECGRVEAATQKTARKTTNKQLNNQKINQISQPTDRPNEKRTNSMKLSLYSVVCIRLEMYISLVCLSLNKSVVKNPKS